MELPARTASDRIRTKSPSVSRPRNILLIVLDQWRGDYLGHLGATWVNTPNIDALARRGVSFARNFCQGAPCGPARTSLQTGKYVMNHRVVHNGVPLDSRHDHLARMLRRAGYDPSLIGYSTTTPDPRYVSRSDFRFSRNGDIADSWRVIAQMDELRDQTDMARNYLAWVSENEPSYSGRGVNELWAQKSGAARPDGSECVIEAALSDTAWLADNALTYLRGVSSQDSWMLHFGLSRPHPPFSAPAPFHRSTVHESLPAVTRAATRMSEAGGHPYLAHLHGSQHLGGYLAGGAGSVASLSAAELDHVRAAYCGLIEEADHHIGRVLDELKSRALVDDTLIILTSDHGEQLGDHSLLGKMGFYDQSYHVPLIIVDPHSSADTTRGRVEHGLSESIDILPTILEWLGMPCPHTVDGKSLLPAVRGEQAGGKEAVHFEFSLRGGFLNPDRRILGLDYRRSELAVLRTQTHKYVHFQGLPALLFDLTEDPHELTDRATDPRCREVMLDMAQRMLNWRMYNAERELVNLNASPAGLVRLT